MKNKICFSVFILSIVLMVACNKGKTYAELLKEETTATDRFIDQNDFVILNELPKDTVFGEKEFYKTPSGLYLNVIDKGIPVSYVTNDNIYIRFNGRMSFKNDTSKISVGPLIIMYNNPYSYSLGSNPYFICDGMLEPISYVGYEGKVKLIIPSKIGTSSDQSNVLPVYYDEVIYTTDTDKILN